MFPEIDTLNLVVAALLVAAAMQAAWNLSVRASSSPFLTICEINATVGLLAVPVLASVRVGVFQGEAFSLYGRAGGGLLPFRHQLSSDFQEDLKESKLGAMGFLSFQGAYRLGRWSALAEVRGAWAPARTPSLDAQLGGLSGLLGMRFEP